MIDCVELTYDLWCHYGAWLIINHNLLVLLLVLTSDHPISDDLRQITYCCDGGTKKTSLDDHILTAKNCVNVYRTGEGRDDREEKDVGG